MCRRTPAAHCPKTVRHCTVGSGQRGSSYTLPQCVGQWAVGGLRCTTTAIGNAFCSLPHCRQWAVALRQYIVAVPRGTGRWYSCGAEPHCLGAVGSGTSSAHCPTALGQCAVGSGTPPVHLYTASPPWGDGHGTPSVHRHTAGSCGPWDSFNALGLLQCTATLLGIIGQWDSFSALPHCWGSSGSGTPSVH